MSRSPNAGQTALTLQHTSGYNVPPGHNADGYTMAERVNFAKGGKAKKNWIQSDDFVIGTAFPLTNLMLRLYANICKYM